MAKAGSESIDLKGLAIDGIYQVCSDANGKRHLIRRTDLEKLNVTTNYPFEKQTVSKTYPNFEE